MEYLTQANEAYKQAIFRAERKLTKGVLDRQENLTLAHPLRVMQSANIMPLHIVFNTGNQALPRMLLKLLLESNPYDTIEVAIKKTPLLINNFLPDSYVTFKEQVNSFIKLTYPHSFLLQGGHIQKNSGVEVDTNSVFFKVENGELYDFDEKIRTIDGIYAFKGKTPIIVLTGKPIKKAELAAKPYLIEQIKHLAHLPAVKAAMDYLDGQKVKTKSIAQQYTKSNSLSDILKL